MRMLAILHFYTISILLHFLSIIILGDNSSLARAILNSSLNKVICLDVCVTAVVSLHYRNLTKCWKHRDGLASYPRGD